MEYRRLGQAGLKVSEIGLGAWLTFGDAVDRETAQVCIKAAVESGVNFLDNADVYANGEAERVMGEVIRNLGLRRQDLVISSKVFWPMSDGVNDRGLSRKHIIESVESSLRRLGTEYLDLYFCHRYDPETPVEEVVRAMDDLVHQGKVLYWGTSVWSAAQIEAAVGAARAFRAYPPQVEQPRYNMLDRHVEPEILPTCAKYGIGVTVFSPLAQGLLTGKYNDGVPADSRGGRSNWLKGDLTEANVAKARRLTAAAQSAGLTMSQLALAWILRRPEISAVVTGATRPAHVESNVQAAGVRLPDDLLAEITRILEDEE
ncbi:MAG TPA: aldo/keto reductase [Chloroflexi bacterium]|nr:aldo/keto reductase [Chloroflexota bacterium]